MCMCLKSDVPYQNNNREIMLILWIVLVSVAVASGRSRTCEETAIMAAQEDEHTVVETSDYLLTGTWISEGCEVRPGPEYVLRSYNFNSDGTFILYQHHYKDDSCSHPKFTVTSHGRIHLGISLIQPGARRGNVKTTNITVTPHNTEAILNLNHLLTTECPGLRWRSWQIDEEQVVYQYLSHKWKNFHIWRSSRSYNGNQHRRNNNQYDSPVLSCLGSLKWAFYELKLLKIQIRPIHKWYELNARLTRVELLLGDIHSNIAYRETYTPTSFQAPLVKKIIGYERLQVGDNVYHVKNVNFISSHFHMDGRTPPNLLEKPHLPPYIWGEWTSLRCEVRPLGMYLMRKYTFYEEDNSWIGDHKFFADPFCLIHRFTVTAAGHLSLKGVSMVVMGATNIDFHIERASMTVLDERMLYDIQVNGDCVDDNWAVDVPQELSSSEACLKLGIAIPSIQRDIIRIEMDFKGSGLMYLGQADTDNFQSTSATRPTAYQPPLVKCDGYLFFSSTEREIFSSNSADYYSRTFPCLMVYLVIFIVMKCFIN